MNILASAIIVVEFGIFALITTNKMKRETNKFIKEVFGNDKERS